MGLLDNIKGALSNPSEAIAAAKVSSEVSSVEASPLESLKNGAALKAGGDLAANANNSLVQKGAIEGLEKAAGPVTSLMPGNDKALDSALRASMESSLGKSVLSEIAAIGKQFQEAMESITKGGESFQQGIHQVEEIAKQTVGSAVKGVSSALGIF